jgi:SAM-dependent methyltransferase
MPADLGGSVLDLGCGAGTLTLAAARRTKGQAVGTDVNPRAIAVARFNARLNQVQATFVCGDLYEPVKPERFAWLFCQPPYVLQPPEAPGVTYLHGGARGDALALRALAGAPNVLAEGGRALFLFDAPVIRNKPLHVRVREALGHAPVDLLLLTAPGPSPDLQAVAYASLEVPDFGRTYEEVAVRYRRHVDALGVAEFTRAVALLRAVPARRGPGFTASLPVPSLERMSAPVLESALDGLDLACQDDQALLGSSVHLPPQTRWIEERATADLDAPPTRSVRFPPGWLCGARELSDASAALLATLSKTPKVSAGLEAYATLCAASPNDVRRQVLDFVRESLGRGLLVPG